MNPGVSIVGMPEGTALQLKNKSLQFIGGTPGILFSREENTGVLVRKEIMDGADLSGLIKVS